MDKPKTICVECRHFINKGDYLNKLDVWYDWFCGAVENETVIDPVKGVRTNRRYAYARDINTGDCEYFKKKKVEIFA